MNVGASSARPPMTISLVVADAYIGHNACKSLPTPNSSFFPQHSPIACCWLPAVRGVEDAAPYTALLFRSSFLTPCFMVPCRRTSKACPYTFCTPHSSFLTLALSCVDGRAMLATTFSYCLLPHSLLP